MQTISPFLWFDSQAEEAARFYVSVFPNSELRSVSRYPDDMPGVGGTVIAASFALDGLEFQALNGGPQFPFTEAVSFFVRADTQPVIDDLWAKLTEGGEPGRCGWLKDRFGLSWQVVPPILGELLGDPDQERSGRVMKAMLAMTKIDIAGLRSAYAGA